MTAPAINLESAGSREENVLRRISVAPESLVPERVLRFVRPAPVLDRMVLPGEYLEPLRPALAEVGLTASEELLEQAVLQTTYAFTLLRMGDSVWALLNIPDSILTLFSRENKLALDEVRDLFQGKYNPLYVFHESIPQVTYRNLMLGEWRDKYQLKVKLMPLSDLKDLAQQPLVEQVKYLKRELEVKEAAPPAPPDQPAKHPLTVPELLGLHRVVAKLPEFETARGRRVLVESAGLSEFAENFDFEGSAATVAGDLVNSLAKSRRLRPLLEVVKLSKDLPASDNVFIQETLEMASFD